MTKTNPFVKKAQKQGKLSTSTELVLSRDIPPVFVNIASAPKDSDLPRVVRTVHFHMRPANDALDALGKLYGKCASWMFGGGATDGARYLDEIRKAMK